MRIQTKIGIFNEDFTYFIVRVCNGARMGMKPNKEMSRWDALFISSYFVFALAITLFGLGFSLWIMEALYNTFNVERFYSYGYGTAEVMLVCLKWVPALVWTLLATTLMTLPLDKKQKKPKRSKGRVCRI